MKNYIVRSILSKPGIQRDSTPFASENYIDGQWCRFYMGKPRKIGGYQLIDAGIAGNPPTDGIIRSLFNISKPNNTVDTYLGRADSLNVLNFNMDGESQGLVIDRTPEDYQYNANNVWDFDLFSDVNLGSLVVAQVAPNGINVNNATTGQIYYGNITGINPLTPITFDDGDPVMVSGGIVFASPFLVAYGNNGLIQWSPGGNIENWDRANNLTVANTKILKVFPFKGAANPQLILWTATSVISATYTVLANVGTFSSSIIQEGCTLMSPNCIVSYEQQFFWIGTNQFYFFNGIVQTLPNNMSNDYFFGNVNMEQRGKIWGMAIPRYKEIWWHYPTGYSTECNAVIIYNVELQTWYDSTLSRAAGLASGVFPLPMMSSNVPINNTYPLWQHEYGFDDNRGLNQSYAIPSYFETGIFTLFANQPDNNRLVRSRRIEPDFLQRGEMTVTVNNRMFASDTLDNGRLIQTGPYTFNPDTPKIDDVNSQGRLVSYRFDSNEAGGYYQAGNTLLDYEVGDVHPSP